ncbi:sialic acid synthase-like [Panonychus citri]|uniref:sialic acid synthase-like n=1 Tax=Panonychus citri TaxID=50023 RepID=UPI002306EBA5|nr:sialic acid synthase-like [Panonychus citri]XP_053214479.1 sialic acid synthase-like [Panonychus citri]
MSGKVSFELHPGRLIGDNQACYVIAEIGQNHQGSMSIAMDLIAGASKAGVDCVKFQKSNLTRKFTQSALSRPYQGFNSFGSTYGEHKKSLELTNEQFVQLKDYANNQGVQFTASPMDIDSVDFLASIKVPFLKIGSGDTNNYPLIKRATNYNQPIVLSTGMTDVDIVQQSVSIIKESGNSLAILQCTSSYPCPPEHVNLNVIKTYQRSFPFAVIGYSGHESADDDSISLAAVALGAKVLERHVTLDQSMKGSDHRCSLNLEQLTSLIKKIRTIEKAFGSNEKVKNSSEIPCYLKLGKSIVTTRTIKKGETINESMLDIKVSEPPGIAAHKFYQLIGRKVNKDLMEDNPIQSVDLD